MTNQSLPWQAIAVAAFFQNAEYGLGLYLKLDPKVFASRTKYDCVDLRTGALRTRQSGIFFPAEGPKVQQLETPLCFGKIEVGNLFVLPQSPTIVWIKIETLRESPEDYSVWANAISLINGQPHAYEKSELVFMASA